MIAPSWSPSFLIKTKPDNLLTKSSFLNAFLKLFGFHIKNAQFKYAAAVALLVMRI